MSDRLNTLNQTDKHPDTAPQSLEASKALHRRSIIPFRAAASNAFLTQLTAALSPDIPILLSTNP